MLRADPQAEDPFVQLACLLRILCASGIVSERIGVLRAVGGCHHMQNCVVAVTDLRFGKAVRTGVLCKLHGGNIGAAVEQSSVTEDQHLFGGGFLRFFFGSLLCGELVAEQQAVKGKAPHILRRFAAVHQSSRLLGNGDHLYAVRGKPCGQVWYGR